MQELTHPFTEMRTIVFSTHNSHVAYIFRVSVCGYYWIYTIEFWVCFNKSFGNRAVFSVYSYSCLGVDKPGEFQKIEASRIFRKSVTKLARLSALRTDHLYPQGRFLVLISARGWINKKSQKTPTGIEPATSWLLYFMYSYNTFSKISWHTAESNTLKSVNVFFPRNVLLKW